MSKKTIIIILVVALLAGGVILGVLKYRSGNSDPVEEAPVITPVKVVPVIKGSIREILSGVGNVAAREEVRILPKVSGKIWEIIVEEGQKVAADQVLATIDRDIEGMKFEKAAVKSPIDGVVLKKYLDAGAQVAPGAPALFTVANLESVKVLMNIAEQHLGKLKEGMKTEIRVDAYPGELFPGEVTRIAPSVDIATRTAEVETIIANRDHRLKPGMFARVNIILERKEDAPVIPVKAVLSKDSRKYVMVVTDSVARRKDVKTGIYRKETVEIIEGLASGESVVVEGNYGLKDGASVEIREQTVY